MSTYIKLYYIILYYIILYCRCILYTEYTGRYTRVFFGPKFLLLSGPLILCGLTESSLRYILCHLGVSHGPWALKNRKMEMEDNKDIEQYGGFPK